MKSSVIKRSIVISGHKTSVSLEDQFWHGLREIAQAQRQTVSFTVGEIDKSRLHNNLSSAIRLFVLDRLREAALSRPRHAQESIDAGQALGQAASAQA